MGLLPSVRGTVSRDLSKAFQGLDQERPPSKLSEQQVVPSTDSKAWPIWCMARMCPSPSSHRYGKAELRAYSLGMGLS